MIFIPLALDGAYKIDLEKREDERGFFARFFCENEFAAHGLVTEWKQINTSLSHQMGTLRGLHFQRPPRAEVKLVRCLKGSILDVVVDVREGSANFGQHVAIELNEGNRTMLYVPHGFAHGFQTLVPHTEILYLNSEFYNPEMEGGLHHADPKVGINWPLPVTELSERDKTFPVLDNLEPIRL
jgi:dTDP-4-dehydrorhamnose 3,5-epimerase